MYPREWDIDQMATESDLRRHDPRPIPKCTFSTDASTDCTVENWIYSPSKQAYTLSRCLLVILAACLVKGESSSHYIRYTNTTNHFSKGVATLKFKSSIDFHTQKFVNN